MKTISIFVLVLFMTLTTTNTRAQHRVMMNFNYSVNIPSGSFKDYISNTSFRGWNATIYYRLNEKLALGGAASFQDFYQKKDRAIYKDAEGTDISAVVSNSIQTIPLMAHINYSFGEEYGVRPYVALGLGGNLVIHSQYFGQFSNEYTSFKFAARPEAGVFIPIKKDRDIGVNLSGSYNIMPYNENDVENLNSWGVSVGVRFPLK